MIHRIKSLFDNGNGSSIRAIAEALNISRNTVRQYLRSDEKEIVEQQECRERTKQLDEYRDYIIHLLQTYPKLSAVKILRKLKEQYQELGVSGRSVRRYVKTLKLSITLKQQRYYQPVLDMVAGIQCQVDPGELRGVKIGGVDTIVYFVVFVLSYSRLMYVGISREPINTTCFIAMHDAAFRYFEGCPKECVYDQTKMVVLQETWRELTLNQQFHQYATLAGFQIRACEGYDPESKGKVEAGVKYVQNNGLYGEEFNDWSAVQAYVLNWLDTIANVRLHAVTGRLPLELYNEQERAQMQPYGVPVLSAHPNRLPRKADKTSLISYAANKYSVPQAWQSAQVGVRCENEQLIIEDLETDSVIATHPLCHGKGQIIKNRNHYRDPGQSIRQYEQQVAQLLAKPLCETLCQKLKESSPKIYRDQLVGLLTLIKQYQPDEDLLWQLSERPRLTACQLKSLLEAHQQAAKRGERCLPEDTNTTLDLSAYATLSQPNRQEVAA